MHKESVVLFIVGFLWCFEDNVSRTVNFIQSFDCFSLFGKGFFLWLMDPVSVIGIDYFRQLWTRGECCGRQGVISWLALRFCWNTHFITASLFQWIDILFPLQYKSCCIRRHARLFSNSFLDYKTCNTNYSKTRLEYRTQQPSLDVTMTS